MKALQTGGGQPPRPTELDFVNDAVGRLPPGSSPQAIKMTRDGAQAQFGVLTKTMTEMGDNTLTDAQRWLSQNPGATVAQLPADLRDRINQYAPANMAKLEEYSKTLGRGDVVTNRGRYDDIVTHMDLYAKMGPGAWNQILQTELSQRDAAHLSQRRADFINGKTSDTADGFNSAAVNRAVNENLLAMKLPTITPKNDPETAERIGGIRMWVDQSIADAQHGLGRKMTPVEIHDYVNKLAHLSAGFTNTGIFGGQSTSSQTVMSMTVKDLPDGAYQGLKQDLIAGGNKAPTDTDILNRYRELHVRGQVAAR
jgi:soluble lytic murein transglycosylase